MTSAEVKVDSLRDALTWDVRSVAVVSEWRTAYERLLERRFQSTASSDPSGLLMKAAELMSREEFDHLLLSPRVAWCLLYDAPGSVRAIQGEILRALQEELIGGENAEESSVQRGCIRVAEFLVDSGSSFDCPGREPGEPPLTRIPPETEAAVFGQLEKAAASLKSQTPSVHTFVQRMTTRIVMRSDDAQRSSAASSSFRDHPGLTLIANPQALGDDALRLIDALVHEAVHAAIYMYEALTVPLCPSEDSLRVCSRWSGRPLTVDQYVQACFVWWGLFNLWRTWSVHSSDPRAVSLLARAARGFHLSPVSALRREAGSGYLNEHLWDVLFDIEKRSAGLLAAA